MTKKPNFSSLYIRMFLCIIFSLALAVSIFFIGRIIENLYMENIYMDADAVSKRNIEHIRSLENFVQERDISSQDISTIVDWIGEQEYVYMLFYRNNHYIFGADGLGMETDPPENPENHYTFYPINFSDGVVMTAAYDYSNYHVTYVWDLVLLLLSSVSFITVMLIFSHWMVTKITLLSKKVQSTACDLQRTIELPGKDEIALLAENIDSMREVLVERIASEQTAVKANSDLITAISHDIRTPLTAIQGYLDLISNGQFDSREEFEAYIKSCRGKTNQLKNLTDELFGYFLVFNNETLPLNIDSYDANLLLIQILSEHIARLETCGFSFDGPMYTIAGKISTDTNYLTRVFDNLFSNIEHHGDKRRTVTVELTAAENRLHLTITNAIPEQPNNVSSTKIGLKSSEKIMKHLNGELEITADGHLFTAKLTLPFVRDVG